METVMSYSILAEMYSEAWVRKGRMGRTLALGAQIIRRRWLGIE